MKILIVNRFFGGAQIPTGRMAEDVARLLVEAGHEVVALASTGTYAGAEKRGGDESRVTGGGEYVGAARRADGIRHAAEGIRLELVPVPKWMPRALAWVWFTWQARQRIPRMGWDVCVLMTDPPLLPLLARRAAGMRHEADGIRENSHEDAQKDLAGQPRDRTTASPTHRAKRRVAVWLMDLYPEALAASGRIGTENSIYRWYFSKRQKALGSVDLLICLGQTQKERLETKRPKDEKLDSELHTASSIRKEGREGGGENGISVGRYFGRAEGTETLKHRNTEPPRPPLTQRVRTAVVPPWDDRGNIALATEESLRNLVLYAGNLGEAHCFKEVLAAAPYLPADWTIRFAVRGAKLGALKEKANQSGHGLRGLNTDGVRAAAPTGLRGSAHAVRPTALAVSPPNEEVISRGSRVEVTGYASEAETPELLASARVHLITMSPGWEGIVVPSKLYGCIRTGRPVLFIGPEDADTALEIRAHGWGKVLPPGVRGEEVAAAILELAARPTRATQSENGAKQVAELIQGLATE